MSYTPKTWVDGEVIYHQDLNRMEQGIQAALSGEAKVLFVETDPTTGFPQVTNPVSDIIYACLKLPQEQTSINSLYNFWTHKGVWQNISQGPKGDGNFTFIKYSEGQPASDLDIHDEFLPSTDKYIGFYNGTSSEAPSDHNEYTWCKFMGTSPVITIEQIQGGNRVTITDEANPEGHSFIVLDGVDAVNPFKGWFTTDNIPTTGQEGDYCYVTEDGTTKVWRWNPNAEPPAFEETPNTPDTDHTQTFASNESVNEVAIDKSHLENPNNSFDPNMPVLADARDVKKIKLKTDNSVAVEEKITDYEILNGHVVTNGGTINYASSQANTKHAVVPLPNIGEYRKIRFLGLTYASSITINIGYALYDSNGNLLYCVRFPNNLVEGAQEVVIAVPPEAATLKTTVKRNANNHENDFYCYVQTGESLQTQPTLSVDYAKGSSASAKVQSLINIKLGIVESNNQLTRIPFTFVPGRWSIVNHSITSSSADAHIVANVEGYRYIVFLGYDYTSAPDYGYVFFDINSNIKKEEAYKVSETAGHKIYIVEVPNDAVTFYSTYFSNMFIYGYNGTLLDEDIEELFRPKFLEVEELLNTLSEYSTYTHGKNYINKNDLLENYTINNKEYGYKEGALMSNKLYLENGTYTVQGVYVYTPDSSPRIIYARFKSDGTFINRVTLPATNGIATFTYTKGSEDYVRVVIQFNANTINLNNVQLEAGSEATNVEPYEEIFVGYDIAKESDLTLLGNRVAAIEAELQRDESVNRLMKVTIAQDSITIRTRYSDTEDFILVMEEKMLSGGTDRKAQSLTLNSFYVAPNDLTDAQAIISTYRIRSIGDSVGAIGVDSFWYLYAQHGWTIPRMAIGTNNVTQDDVGSVWLANNKRFILGFVAQYLYFIPECTLDQYGRYVSSWQATDGYPSTFTHVSGAVHTDTITGSTSRYDLRVQNAARKHIVDGVAVSYGTYYCDDYSFCEYINGINPAKVTPTDYVSGNFEWTEDKMMIKWGRSFVFKGMTVAYNLSINVVDKFGLTNFYGCIPQMPMGQTDYNDVTYNSYSFIPKVKKSKNGNPISTPFDSNDGLPNISASRNINDLYDTNDVPERCICYLKSDEGSYKIGMAGGYSLVQGITVPSVRNNLINSTGGILTYGGDSDTKNKFYPHALDKARFTNGIIDTNFVKDFCCYYSWFNPNENVDGVYVYTYKVSDGYIVYVHAFQEFDKVALVLPSYTEGMRFESVVEKTTGASLLTDVVSCNKMYAKFVSFDSRTDNYIVFKIK